MWAHDAVRPLKRLHAQASAGSGQRARHPTRLHQPSPTGACRDAQVSAAPASWRLACLQRQLSQDHGCPRVPLRRLEHHAVAGGGGQREQPERDHGCKEGGVVGGVHGVRAGGEGTGWRRWKLKAMHAQQATGCKQQHALSCHNQQNSLGSAAQSVACSQFSPTSRTPHPPIHPTPRALHAFRPFTHRGS